MKIIFGHDDFVAAVKQYVQDRFSIEVDSVDITGTKGNMSATIDLPSDIQVTLGPAKLDRIPGRKPEKLDAFDQATVDAGNNTTEKVKDEPVVEAPPKEVVNTTAEAPNLFGTAEAAPAAVVKTIDPLVEEEVPVNAAPLGDNLFAVSTT